MMTDDEIEALAKKHIAPHADLLANICKGWPPYQQTEQFRRVKAFVRDLEDKLRAPVADERAASFNPEECSKEVYERGTFVGLFDIPKHVANELCAGISSATGAHVDWHYFGGRVRVLALASAPVAGGQFKAAFPNGVLPVEKYHELWERAGEKRNPNYTLLDNLTWQVGMFGDLVAKEASAPVAGEARPVAWLVKRHNADVYEIAEPHEKATNPTHWSNAFPVYAAPQARPDTSEADASPIVPGGPYSDPEDLIAALDAAPQAREAVAWMTDGFGPTKDPEIVQAWRNLGRDVRPLVYGDAAPLASKPGYALVPIEPTKEMLAAAFELFELAVPGYATGNDARRAIYKAMVGAAK